MRRAATLLCAALVLIARPALGASYFGYEEWGSTWSDAEKSPLNGDDDQMCWAATAANVLEWAGWGRMAGYNNADDIFGYFQDHWTDAGGTMRYAWNWWFEGTNPSQQWTGWSHVEKEGGGFTKGLFDFQDYFHRTATDQSAMSAIDDSLRAGFGVGLIVTESGRSHTLTCWGYEYDDSGYLGIWVTDSDDDEDASVPVDSLRYIPVSNDGGRWYLRDYFPTDTWYVNEVQALAPHPERQGSAIPEPTSAVLLGLAGIVLPRRRRMP